MCNYKIWFHDEKVGYIVECDQCKRMQLCFGNILVALDEPAFKGFCHHVSSVRRERMQACIDRNARSIIINTPFAGISFILTANELEGLCCMMDYVDTEIKTAALLKMFEATH
jgi:hypothetical protein